MASTNPHATRRAPTSNVAVADAASPASPARRTASRRAAALWLTGGALFDGTGSAARPGAAVLVRDGVIEAIAPAGEPPPADADVIELDGRTLMPGLIDAHAHVKAELPQPDPGAEPLLANTRAPLPRRRPA